MARQVLPIVGAAAGFFLGGPTGAQIGFALGSIVGNAVDPQTIQGPKIGEAGLQTSAEGVFRPIVFGTGAVKGNVIERGNRQVKTQRTQQGKGGGPVTEEQRVYWTFAIRIAEGPIAGILRIWQDEKLVYDVRPGSTIPDETEDFAERFTLYLGDEDQLPDPDLEAYKGVGNVNAYRGTAYIVFPNYDLTDRRESVPDFRFEVSSSGDITTSGRWFYGPASQDGPAGGPQNYYLTADNPLDLPSSTPVPIPVWMTAFTRISEANGAVFIHSNGEPGAVSFDRGGNWTQTSILPHDNNVTWSGNFYYCKGKRSADGITWANIPVISQTDLGGSCARPGAVVVSYGGISPHFMVSLNEGTTWSNRPTSNGWIPSPLMTALPSGRFLFTLDTSRGHYTDDLFQTQLNDAYGLPVYRTMLADSGSVFGLTFDGIDTYIRSEDGGITFESVLGVTSYGNQTDNNFGSDPGVIAAIESHGGSPPQNTLHVSTDDGNNWTESGTLYGNGDNIVAGGGGSSGSGDPVPLSFIVSAIHERIGSSQYDVSELTDDVAGIVFAGDYTAADAIRTLMPIYSFDSSEYDAGNGYKIHYPKRGKPVVTTLTIDNLIQAPEKSVREDALERPKVLHLHYENPKVGYAPAKASVRRNSQDVLVVGERSIQVPVSFEDVDEPARIADKLMRQTWVEVGGEEEFIIPNNFLYLVPSDCIGVSLRGQTRRMRIVGQGIIGGRLNLKLLPDRQSAYTSNITGVPVPEPTPPLPSIVGDTIYSYLDIPALNDNNDRLLWYDAATGITPAWYGAQTQHKAGASVEFENSTRFNQNTIMGTLLDALPAASEHYTDTTNTVRVQLLTDDVLESLTQEQFLSEGGSFALENDDGTWEILQYRDADDEGTNTFALSPLLRGRLNTGCSAHGVGARFVLLDGVQSVDAVTAWINTDITHRAVSLGMSPDGATQYMEPYVGKSQIEFPVANILLERDGTDLDVRVVPRHRFGTETNPVVSSNWVGYRITATDGANSISVETLSPTVTFDVTGWASPITVTAAQRNRFTGDGPTVSEDIV